MKMTRRLFANHPAEHMSKEDQVHFHAVLNKNINSLYHIYGLNDIPDPALEGMCNKNFPHRFGVGTQKISTE